MTWRWALLVVVFGVAYGRWAYAAEIGGVDITTLAGLGTAAGTVVAGFLGALWRFWPRGSPPAPPAAAPASQPPAPAPAPVERVPTKSVLVRQIRGDEALLRFGELLPKLERVDWAALDDLGTRLERDHEQLARLIEKHGSATDD